mgnify:CR=1 FL=1|tara:strand:- start:75 stop:647 length:573 start_codon:yes stop_codon:yes gene_type:complete
MLTYKRLLRLEHYKIMKNRALFLDRDGVINEDKNYVYKIHDIEFIDGIFDLIERANKLGYLVIVVTNQSGVGQGFFSEEELKKTNNWIINECKKRNAFIDDIYFCSTHPTKGIGKYKKNDVRRKPNNGMFLEAAKDHNVDLSKSIILGDKATDMDAGFSSGIKKLFLLSNKEYYKESRNVNSPKDIINFL